MSIHPEYYTHLLRRRVTGDPVLKPIERQELDLHLLICLECHYDYAQMLQPQAPEAADAVLRHLQGMLTADRVSPYLRDLARVIQSSERLTGFQRLLWQFVRQDPETLGQFRLFEADVWLHGGG